jgi:hypothetical protein
MQKLAVVFACSAPLWFCLSKTMQKLVFAQAKTQQLKLRFSSCLSKNNCLSKNKPQQLLACVLSVALVLLKQNHAKRSFVFA